MALEFDYYYGSQADQFSFIRIPRVMLTENTFAELSIQAKVLYGVLLDRMSLSRKNAWFDDKNRVFIIYQIGEIQQDLGFTKKKAMELLSELEKFGLLVKKRRGHGLPNILYVKSFMTGACSSQTSAHPRNQEKAVSRGADTGTSDLPVYDSRSPAPGTSRSDDSGTLEVTDPALQEVPAPASEGVPFLGHLKNYTEENNTEMNHIKSNHILSPAWQVQCDDDEMRYDESTPSGNGSSLAEEYRELICENIGYDELLASHPYDGELIAGIADLILETVLHRTEYILIASNQYPTELIRGKFLKLNYDHIEYVMECLRRNTTKVRNIKKYLLTALFNAPSTIDGFYKAEVNHDMPELARAK